MAVPRRWYIDRLRAMSAREVVWRARGSRPSGPPPDPAPAPDWGPPGWRELLLGMLVERRAELEAAAPRIAAGELSFWGRPATLDITAPAWDVDPLSGEPVAAVSRDFDRDIKPILELHRLQHLVPLAAAAALEGRREWARACADQLLDWVRTQPEGRWPAWASGYEASHRLVGWAWVVPLIAEELTAAELAEIGASYAAQADLAAGRPSLHSSANNHRLAEIVGLLAAELCGSPTVGWERLWVELESEAERQLYSDGGTREQASGYFLYVLDILWMAGLLAFAADRPLGSIADRLRSMLDWLRRVAAPNGEPPPLGDDAEDRMLRIGYFAVREADEIAARAESLLDGRPSLARSDRRERATDSELLAESGVAVMRSRIGGEQLQVIVDVGELGFGSIASHAHADALSVLVWFDGRWLIRDSGTFSYSPAEGRDADRSTAAHSTVAVDGRDQAEMRGPHLWGRRYSLRLESNGFGTTADHLRASHDGFRRDAAGATHARSVHLLRPDVIVVLDRVEAATHCEARLRWQLASDTVPGRLGERGHLVVLSRPEADDEYMEVRSSPRYRNEQGAVRAEWSARGREVVFATLIAPVADAPPQAELSHLGGVTRLRLLGPRAVEIREGWHDEPRVING